MAGGKAETVDGCPGHLAPGDFSRDRSRQCWSGIALLGRVASGMSRSAAASPGFKCSAAAGGAGVNATVRTLSGSRKARNLAGCSAGSLHFNSAAGDACLVAWLPGLHMTH